MANILFGSSGTSLDLAFPKIKIDCVIDDQWGKYRLSRKFILGLYWKIILKKPFGRVCYGFKKIHQYNPKKDIVYLGDLSRRETLMPMLIEAGFIPGVTLFEAFDLSPNLCTIRRQSATKEDIRKKDYEDDDLKLSILAQMIPPDVKSICDLGCGLRKLKKHLKEDVEYIGIDYIQKAEDIINLDMNKESIPIDYYDCYFGCGILEFIDNIENLINQITANKPKYIIFSYSPREYSRISTVRSNVYHNCIYSCELTSYVCSKGYLLMKFQRYEGRQAFYFFERA